eukprot:TRINITY_DN27009_c0_g1_i1.p1 TRINITY_DN27009_c0_g1~~TRINITY_DN27009_c0_g1_i1.p1  ORF type:complete len:521 (-),score=89.25 TRINITY_DN27009_c0_g1_i1:85-1479(-)
MSGLFVDDINTEATAIFCLIVMVILSILIPGVIGYGLFLRFSHTKAKPFNIFLCHHKAGCGSTARLLKMTLAEEIKYISKKIWLDSDDLTDLEKLFDYVGSQSDTLAMLCSADILMRPWCMGELVTAKNKNVRVVRVLFPDFQEPDDKFIDNYDQYVPGITVLAEHGISLDMVQDMLRWLRTLPKIKLGGLTCPSVTADLTTKLAMVATATDPSQYGSQPLVVSFKPEAQPDDRTTAILVDNSQYESVATASILSKLLISHFAHDPEAAPFVLSQGMSLPANVKTILIICTNGVFRQPQVLQALMEGAKRGVKQVPILADENFRFPSEAFLKDHEPIAKSVTKDDPAALLQVIKDVFKEIAIVFQPELYSTTAEILTTKAVEVHQRLRSTNLGKLAWTPTVSPSCSIQVEDVQQVVASKDDDKVHGLNENDVLIEMGGLNDSVEMQPVKKTGKDGVLSHIEMDI